MAALRLIRFYRETPFDCRDSVLELLEALEEREMSTERVAPKWLKHVEGQIQERFADSLSLSSLALDAGVHPTHLARVYRLRYGASVTDKIQTLRTEYASERILEGASIGEAAALAGFSDQFHFSRMLKRRFGYSPSTLKQLTCGNRS
jgi:AraC family transcriptional regulator